MYNRGAVAIFTDLFIRYGSATGVYHHAPSSYILGWVRAHSAGAYYEGLLLACYNDQTAIFFLDRQGLLSSIYLPHIA